MYSPFGNYLNSVQITGCGCRLTLFNPATASLAFLLSFMLTQDPNKLSAHIEAASKRAVTYQANTGILINLAEVFDGL